MGFSWFIQYFRTMTNDQIILIPGLIVDEAKNKKVETLTEKWTDYANSGQNANKDIPALISTHNLVHSYLT